MARFTTERSAWLAERQARKEAEAKLARAEEGRQAFEDDVRRRCMGAAQDIVDAERGNADSARAALARAEARVAELEAQLADAMHAHANAYEVRLRNQAALITRAYEQARDDRAARVAAEARLSAIEAAARDARDAYLGGNEILIVRRMDDLDEALHVLDGNVVRGGKDGGNG